jgi:hypothetical protein
MALRLLLAPALALATLEASQGPATAPETLTLFLRQLEQVALSGDRDRFTGLAEPAQGEGAEPFWRAMSPPPDRIVIKDRDHTVLADGTHHLLLEILTVRDQEGRVSTWNARVRQVTAAEGDRPASWTLASVEELASVDGLHLLSLDASRQFDVTQLRISAPDFALSMATGTAFLATVADGATAAVLLGRGTMTFTPPDEAERTQLKLFAGTTALDAAFDMALLRLHPEGLARVIASGMLEPRAVSASNLQRAARYFDETVGHTLTVDLTDLSRERWSLVPRPGDVVAEVRTRRFGGLTYARFASQPEDVALFHRQKGKNVSSYTSADSQAAHSRFYSEDDYVDYDVESIEVDTDIDPNRYWIEGRATLQVTPRTSLTSLTLKLADTLTVRSLIADGLGRLIFFRVVGQDSVMVRLPATLRAGQRLLLRINYGGRLRPQALEPEAPPSDPPPLQALRGFEVVPEPRLIYSTRSYWYPHSTVPDYATARLRITVPDEYQVVATGTPIASAAESGSDRTAPPGRRAFAFEAGGPVPYLACIISRFDIVSETTVDVPTLGVSGISGGPADNRPGALAPLSLVVQANPRQTSRARDVARSAAALIEFYATLLGDAPYPTLTIAVSENHTPGGHSPAYLALADQALQTSRLVWRDDPVSFPGFRDYVLAHEIAHQWWGQAVGGENYRERWISEGFAQYFAALYAEREMNSEGFEAILRRMQRSAIDASDQGPIWLGYRLGHIRNDSRVFRAIVYNKAAMVLHMLRRLVGDAAFFDGLRHFYATFRFSKAGTDDFRLAMEAASGRDLQPFFDAWIFGASIPRLKVSRAVSATNLTVTFDQIGPVLPVPVTVTVVYADGSTQKVIVPVVTARASHTIPLRGALRDVRIDDDHAALARFDR